MLLQIEEKFARRVPWGGIHPGETAKIPSVVAVIGAENMSVRRLTTLIVSNLHGPAAT